MTDPGEWQVDGEEFLANPWEVNDVPDATPDPPPAVKTVDEVPVELPPTPRQIVEAMLFVGGPPLTVEQIRLAIRGLSDDHIREAIRDIGHMYKKQNRPYAIREVDGAFQLSIKPSLRSLKAKLESGPREARLSQPALDLLSLIAYRQPIAKADLETIRGGDCSSPIRQLVRLGLIAAGRRGEPDESAGYVTTARFLDLFQIESLDDLPRLGESHQLS